MEDQSRLTIITHGEDPDGIISQAILWRYYCVKEGESHQRHFFARYDHLLEPFLEALRQDPRQLIVADISLNQELIQAGEMPGELLRSLAQQSGITWYDHHLSTQQSESYFQSLRATVHYSDTQCAAKLVAKDLLRGDPYVRELAKIAQANDYQNCLPQAPTARVILGDKLEGIISLFNAQNNQAGLFLLAEALQRDQWRTDETLLQPYWEIHVQEFQQESIQARAELETTVEIPRIESSRVLIGLADPILYPKAAPRYLREHYAEKADLFVTLFQAPCRNHVILSHHGNLINVPALCQSLGGGGRDNGGGFTLPFEITSESFSHAKNYVINRVEEYLQRRST